jgi:hypothetical protein
MQDKAGEPEALKIETKSLGPGRVVVEFTGGSDLVEEVAGRHHDMTSALRAFTAITIAIKAGYRFTDARSAAKISCMENALRVMSREADLLAQVYLSLSG